MDEENVPLFLSFTPRIPDAGSYLPVVGGHLFMF